MGSRSLLYQHIDSIYTCSDSSGGNTVSCLSSDKVAASGKPVVGIQHCRFTYSRLQCPSTATQISVSKPVFSNLSEIVSSPSAGHLRGIHQISRVIYIFQYGIAVGGLVRALSLTFERFQHGFTGTPHIWLGRPKYPLL